MKGAEIITLTGLTLLSAIDIRTRQIPVIGALLLGAALCLCRLWSGGEFLPMALSVIPGLFVLLLSLASREQIGLGDGLVLLALGFGNGIGRILGMLGMAFFFAGLWAVVLLVVKKAGRKKEFPFLPFLLAGYGVSLLLE